MNLIIVRHAESLNNVPGSVWVADPDVSPRGLQQARLLGERCEGLAIDALVCSPLLRALRTANEISIRKNNMPVHILHELVEVGTDYAVRGHARAQEICPAVLPYDDVPAGDYGDGYDLAIKDPYYLQSRAYRVISRVRQTFAADATVVLVGHVGINQRLLAAALRMSLPSDFKFAQDNTCVNVVNYSTGEDGREVTRFVMMNDTAHLH
ncbi:MAG: histidine phosphatase family protein [Firmicutes bacterium]|nr:histidine phosphatase family protein [Bacillota bacterium]